MNLEPLADGEMQELLEGLLPGVPPSAVQAIVHRAEGVPLYAVETVRMLLDTGAVVPDGDRYAVTGDLTDMAVAETLQALIAARLDANSPQDRSLIQDAAVLGLSFSVDALAAVSGREASSVASALERLTRRQLIAPDNDPLSPERGQYRFVQALLREVAYQSLARPDRRARHLAAARYLESQGEDELAGVLANHYIDAFHASKAGPEASALAGQARIAALAAADRAVSLHSHRQALAYLLQALGVTDDPAERASIHERLMMAAEYAGDIELVREHGPQAVEIYRGMADEPAALRAATALGSNLIGYHIEDEGLQVLLDAIEHARPAGDIPELAGAWAMVARTKMLREEHEEAVTASDRALAMGSSAAMTTVVEALITKATSLISLGRLAESDALLRGAIDLADRSGLVFSALRARNNLAGSLQFRDLAESDRLFREGYEMATRYGHRPFMYQFLYTLADNAVRLGNLDEWTSEIQSLQENESPTPFYQAGFEGTQAFREDLRGDYARADEMLARSAELFLEVQSVQAEAAQELFHGRHELLQGNWDKAIARSATAAANSNFVEEGNLLAGVAAAAGDRPDALEHATAMLEQQTSEDSAARPFADIFRAVPVLRAGGYAEAQPVFTRVLAALEKRHEVLLRALAQMLWGALAAEHSPEAAEAGREAAEFFAGIGGSAMVERFTAAVVTPGAAAPRRAAAAAPRGAKVRSGSRR
jgi:hypothetical protein